MLTAIKSYREKLLKNNVFLLFLSSSLPLLFSSSPPLLFTFFPLMF